VFLEALMHQQSCSHGPGPKVIQFLTLRSAGGAESGEIGPGADLVVPSQRSAFDVQPGTAEQPLL
jgi:hypothetical protein